jgi:hypothetical protein
LSEISDLQASCGDQRYQSCRILPNLAHDIPCGDTSRLSIASVSLTCF